MKARKTTTAHALRWLLVFFSVITPVTRAIVKNSKFIISPPSKDDIFFNRMLAIDRNFCLRIFKILQIFLKHMRVLGALF